MHLHAAPGASSFSATSAPRGVIWAKPGWPTACGVSPTGQGRQFLLTSGAGDMRLGPEGVTLPGRQTAEMLQAYAWDNHAVLFEFPS